MKLACATSAASVVGRWPTQPDPIQRDPAGRAGWAPEEIRMVGCPTPSARQARRDDRGHRWCWPGMVESNTASSTISTQQMSPARPNRCRSTSYHTDVVCGAPPGSATDQRHDDARPVGRRPSGRSRSCWPKTAAPTILSSTSRPHRQSSASTATATWWRRSHRLHLASSKVFEGSASTRPWTRS